MDLDLKHFIERNKEIDISELMNIIQVDLKQLKILRITNENSYEHERYKDHIQDLAFFLHNEIVPGNTGINGIRLFKPIIKRLVETRQIDQSYLLMIE